MLGAAQTSHGITCPGSKSVQWGWDDARNEEQEVPWWREDLAQSWFSPFPLSSETKPLLELHPKIAFFLASRKPKTLNLAMRVFLEDSLTLSCSSQLSWAPEVFSKGVFQIFGTVSAHSSTQSHLNLPQLSQLTRKEVKIIMEVFY